MVELVDLFPTLTELCDVSAPAELQGRSLVPMLRDSTIGGKQLAYTVVMRGKAMGKAIRTDRYRYTRWPGSEELYDLKEDSAEDHNLADSQNHLSVINTMRAHLRSAEVLASSKNKN